MYIVLYICCNIDNNGKEIQINKLDKRKSN